MKIITGILCFINFFSGTLSLIPFLLTANMIWQRPEAKGDWGAYAFVAFFASFPLISFGCGLISLLLINKKPVISLLVNFIALLQLIAFVAYLMYIFIW